MKHREPRITLEQHIQTMRAVGATQQDIDEAVNRWHRDEYEDEHGLFSSYVINPTDNPQSNPEIRPFLANPGVKQYFDKIKKQPSLYKNTPATNVRTLIDNYFEQQKQLENSRQTFARLNNNPPLGNLRHASRLKSFFFPIKYAAGGIILIVIFASPYYFPSYYSAADLFVVSLTLLAAFFAIKWLRAEVADWEKPFALTPKPFEWTFKNADEQSIVLKMHVELPTSYSEVCWNRITTEIHKQFYGCFQTFVVVPDLTDLENLLLLHIPPLLDELNVKIFRYQLFNPEPIPKPVAPVIPAPKVIKGWVT